MKYIIADASGDMAKILYNDLIGKEDYVVIDKAKLYKNKMLNMLARANISIDQNIKHKMPLKKFFYKCIFGHFDKSQNLCFYFGTAWYDPELVDYLKKKYPSAKFVLNFHDTVESKLKRFPYMNVQQIKDEFDLIYTYSEVDQIKYGFEYTPDMYSKLDASQIMNFPESDVVFVGAAKDRLSVICSIFKKLSDAGLNCWFYIVGAKEEEKQYTDKIIYSDKYLPFLELISRQYHAKCILEVTQPGSEDATLRFWDAVMYNKRIITNCSAVKKYSYYSEKMVMVFDSIEDINPEFVNEMENVNFNYEGDISPVKVFEQIGKKLSSENENS